MSSDNDDEVEEEVYEDVDEKLHEKLVANVLDLTQQQHVGKTDRSETVSHISEFDLAQSSSKFHTLGLANVLTKTCKQTAISKRIKRTQQKSKSIPRPLEVVHGERIQRTVAYAKTQRALDEWDPIVASMRSAAHTSFPLIAGNDAKLGGDDKVDWGYKSDVQKALDDMATSVAYCDDGDVDEFPMSFAEMMEKRRAAAKMRALESYQMAKARRQNKIKSKQYHRMRRKEKVRQHLKEFELLQKTNPEAALAKLEEIERARVEERMSLRHKNTGKWAKNNMIRSKYDAGARKMLKEQLTLSRDITEKGKHRHVEQASDDEEVELQADDGKLWLKRDAARAKKQNGNDENDFQQFMQWFRTSNEPNEQPVDDKQCCEDFVSKKIIHQLMNASTINVRKQAKRNNAQKSPTHVDDEWEVSDLGIDQAFDAMIDKLNTKIHNVYNSLQHPVNNNGNSSKTKKSKTLKSKPSRLELLSLPKQRIVPEIDEALNETSDRQIAFDANRMQRGNKLKNCEKSDVHEPDINKAAQNAPIQLQSALPDLLHVSQDEDATSLRENIEEAFQIDNIVEEFEKEKQDDIDAGRPKDIDLTLPGWGSWGGKDLKVSASKRNRFLVKFDETTRQRKDTHKPTLIINEDGDEPMRGHMVSELPFPFKNVRDFEASIRAPVGSTFVPESACRRLTKPAVTAELGCVIEPMSIDMLIHKRH